MTVLGRLLKSPTGSMGIVVVALSVLAAVVAPYLWAEQASTLHVRDTYQGPSLAHVAGTDELGRDIFLRLMVAARLSIMLPLLATALGCLVGIAVGVAAAVAPGFVRTALLRLIDALIVFPAILIAMFIAAIIGIGITGAVLGVAAATSFSFARLAATLTLTVAGRDYVAAARLLRLPAWRVALRHIMPNIADPLIITFSLGVASSIVALSSLSFLGIGVQPPDTDWGQMLTNGVKGIYIAPAAAIAPALAIALVAVAVGGLGEALARAINPLAWPQSQRQQRSKQTALRLSHRGATAQDSRTASSEYALEVEGLTVSLPVGGTEVSAVSDVSLRLRRGQFFGLVGESGSGKTMTALAIAQLVPYPGTASGSIRIGGVAVTELDVRERARLLGTELAMVFQDPMSSLNPSVRLGTQLVEGARHHRRISFGRAKSMAIDALRAVQLPAPRTLLGKYPHQLSGGMRQRAMIAMAIMNEPTLLIADEPTTALDATVQGQVMELLRSVNRRSGSAILFVSHNLALVSQNCDRVAVMYAGRIVEELSVVQLVDEPLHPYTKALLASAPDLSQGLDQRLTSISGQPPDISDVPPGCPFHPRCVLARAQCRNEEPPLLARDGDRKLACWVANER